MRIGEAGAKRLASDPLVLRLLTFQIKYHADDLVGYQLHELKIS